MFAPTRQLLRERIRCFVILMVFETFHDSVVYVLLLTVHRVARLKGYVKVEVLQHHFSSRSKVYSLQTTELEEVSKYE